MDKADAEARLEALEARLDHFKLYDFFPIEVGYRAYLRGQFDEAEVEVRLRELDHLLNPVSKARKGEEPPELVNPMDHYLMYRAPSFEGYVYKRVTILNQFGRQEYELGRAVRMIVPAEKIEKGSEPPVERDHYKVYDILSSKMIEAPVTLTDQFVKNSTVVLDPRFFCVPAEKVIVGDGGKKRFPIYDEEAHLTIYGIDPDELSETREVEDQFGREEVEAVLGVMLAVPTLKLSYKKKG
ncbi:MAG: hypothetical protein K0U98_06605 [Deltaproteobacteria bacterium]|nr:hypothetical protein [Deltaproteobacteria bacterium]